MIISEAFLNSLTNDERNTFEARPVKQPTKSRRRFFELVPHEFATIGAIIGLEVNGWCCDLCERLGYSHGSALGYCVNVVCRQTIPANSPDFFFAGSETDVNLYCTRPRLQSLAGKKWSRKLMGDPLAVVDVTQFDTNPLLGTLDEIAKFRDEHGFSIPFKPKPRV